MGLRSFALIFILVFGVLLSTLYTSDQLLVPRHARDVIPTHARISQLRAIEIVEQDLRNKVPELNSVGLYFSLYNFSEARYYTDSDYAAYIDTAERGGWPFSVIMQEPELLQLPLMFIHANGTTYEVNGTDQSYEISCVIPSASCPYGKIGASYATRDRLVYRIETTWNPAAIIGSSESLNQGYHLIDAETGEIVWNSIDYLKNRGPEPPNVDYEGQKTVKMRLDERLHPEENVEVKILLGSSIQAQEHNFLRDYARGIMTISNRVEWTNDDNVTHTVSSDNGYRNQYTGKFSSGLIAPNVTYGYTFMEVGEYPYHCDIHPWMRGKIEIVENFS